MSRKAIAISQLCKGHRQILVPTRESSRSHIPAVPRDATAKLAIRQKVQQLGENGSALVHAPLSPPPGRALGHVARRVSSTLRHLAWEFSDFLPLSFGRLG